MQQGYFRSCLSRIQVLEAAIRQAGMPVPPNDTATDPQLSVQQEPGMPVKSFSIGYEGNGSLLPGTCDTGGGEQWQGGRRLLGGEVDVSRISAEVGHVCADVGGAGVGRWLQERRASSDRSSVSSDGSDNDRCTALDVGALAHGAMGAVADGASNLFSQHAKHGMDLVANGRLNRGMRERDGGGGAEVHGGEGGVYGGEGGVYGGEGIGFRSMLPPDPSPIRAKYAERVLECPHNSCVCVYVCMSCNVCACGGGRMGKWLCV